MTDDAEYSRLKAIAEELLAGPKDEKYTLDPIMAFCDVLVTKAWWMPPEVTAQVMAENDCRNIADRFKYLEGFVWTAISKTDRYDMARDCLLIAARLFNRPL